MIEIDGTAGGGQILRTSIGLSALTEKPCRIINIRSLRPKPGLKEQHLQGVNAIAKICEGRLLGAAINSTKVEFWPGKISSGKININIGTAGSIGLVLQTVLIPALKAEKGLYVKIKGGATFGKWAPSVPWLENILLPILKTSNYDCALTVHRHGFFPRGSAEVEVRTKPVKALLPINRVEQGRILSIEGISIASLFLKDRNVAERQQKAARELIFKELGVFPNIKAEYVNSVCPGSGIVLWANTTQTIIGSDALGEKGKKAEQVGTEAAGKLVNEINSKAAVDKHSADHLIPYLAWITSNTGKECAFKTSEITDHCKTNTWVVEQFLPVRFEVKEKTVTVKQK